MPKKARFEKPEIFKIQLPLVVGGIRVKNEDAPSALIYNKRRNINSMIPATKALIELFNGEKKIYIKGRYDNKTGKVHIDDFAENQEW